MKLKEIVLINIPDTDPELFTPFYVYNEGVRGVNRIQAGLPSSRLAHMIWFTKEELLEELEISCKRYNQDYDEFSKYLNKAFKKPVSLQYLYENYKNFSYKVLSVSDKFQYEQNEALGLSFDTEVKRFYTEIKTSEELFDYALSQSYSSQYAYDDFRHLVIISNYSDKDKLFDYKGEKILGFCIQNNKSTSFVYSKRKTDIHHIVKLCRSESSAKLFKTEKQALAWYKKHLEPEYGEIGEDGEFSLYVSKA